MSRRLIALVVLTLGLFLGACTTASPPPPPPPPPPPAPPAPPPDAVTMSQEPLDAPEDCRIDRECPNPYYFKGMKSVTVSVSREIDRKCLCIDRGNTTVVWIAPDASDLLVEFLDDPTRPARPSKQPTCEANVCIFNRLNHGTAKNFRYKAVADGKEIDPILIIKP